MIRRKVKLRMSESNTYNPMDLEQLLLNKEYSELTTEEMELAKVHVDGEQEYTEMRIALSAIVSNASTSANISPKDSTKANLMDQFQAAHDKGGSSWWSISNSSFRLTLVGLAAIALLVIFLIPGSAPEQTSNASLKVIKSNDETVVHNELESSAYTEIETSEEAISNSVATIETENTQPTDNLTASTDQSTAAVENATTTTSNDPPIQLNFRESRAQTQGNYDFTEHNVTRQQVYSNDTTPIRFNGTIANQLNVYQQNMAQTRDNRNSYQAQSAFGEDVLPVQQPQNLSRNPDLMKLLHAATEK